jgi:hypothetical protein
MDARSVAKAARDLKVKIIILMDWDLWTKARDDPASIKPLPEAVSPYSNLPILNVDERLVI